MSGIAVLDNFPGSANADLNTIGSWSRHTNFSSNSIALTGAGRVYGNASGARALYLNSYTPPTADYVVSASFYYASSQPTYGDQTCLVGRCSSVASTFYLLFWDDVGFQFALYYCLAGTFTALGFYTPTFSVGQTHLIQLSMIKSTIAMLFDGTVMYSTTDTNVTAAGQAGISIQGQMAYNTGMQLGQFWAGSPLVTSAMQSGW